MTRIVSGVCGFTFCKSVWKYVDLSYFVMWLMRKLLWVVVVLQNVKVSERRGFDWFI